MKKYILSILTLFIFTMNVFAQGTQDAAEMADTLRANGKIYVVVGVVLLVLLGLLTYIILIDRKISKLEKDVRSGK